MTQASTLKTSDTPALDTLTGGAFSAPTSGERAARVRDWLATGPSPEQMQEVFRELSGRDKGAARLLRERLDEIKRSKGQEAIGAEWAEKAATLLAQPKLNIADAMAWQRDAAKAGAPLSREPLAGLKAKVADRIKGIEDLQHRVQVRREAAVLLAQRIEVLSTKSWRDAQAADDSLAVDVPDWQTQATALEGDGNWASVDVKFPPLLEASRAQLQAVWDAFRSALAQAVAADADPAAPLPPVPVWADELRQARGVPAEAPVRPVKPKVDPEVRAKAAATVRGVLAKLEQEISEGHGKASAGAAAALRTALKENGKLIDDKLENQAHAALAAAGELEGWQRWRADQLRQELVAKAEALFEAARPAPVEQVEGQEPAPADARQVIGAVRKPRLGGRKMQENLRSLREQWKQTDQGGPPNHALWKRFDDACNEAYKVVEAWLDKVKSEAAEHKTQRLALIAEMKAWAADNATARDEDWKGFNRVLHQFSDRWRDAGHLSEKAFADLQPLWREAISGAAAPLEAMQKLSLDRRHAMIDEANALGAQPQLRIDAVKALQQRWQAEAQGVPLDRKHEQKLWDAFRKPIDDAFNRKGEERDKAAAQLSERDRLVLDASNALKAANATGDAQKIRGAMNALEAALRGQAMAAEAVAKADQAAQSVQAVQPGQKENQLQPAPAASGAEATGEAPPDAPAALPGPAAAAGGDAAGADADAGASADRDADARSDAATPPPPVSATPAPKPAPKPVVAMRGDDRPGMRKTEPVVPGRGGKFGDRKGAPGGKFPERRDGGAGMGSGAGGFTGGAGRFGDRPAYEDRGPRLGDVAFRAQREALENAQLALKKLAAQAHGEALTQLMTAWEQRSAEQVPGVQELGRAVTPAVRGAWVQSVGSGPAGDPGDALLRLESAADVPTPAEHVSARRMMQLQMLTRRNDPSPAQTWGQDAARVLAVAYDASLARRLQAALKVLLRG